MTQARAEKVLQAALDFEEKGRNFYRKTAEQSNHPLSRTLFAALADDEVRHAERIREIHAAESGPGTWPDPAGGRAEKLEDAIRGFFANHRRELTPETDNVAGYEFAMRMERTGIELYSQFAREADGEGERRFFEALLREEQDHLEALQNVHAYLTQPGDWEQDEESRRWNWMNT